MMASDTPKGTKTRNGIMDVAQEMILDRGFAGTPIGDIISGAGVTKGAFFHHFESKQDLAEALMERYAAADLDMFDRTMKRAEALTRDPLQRVLIFLGLYQEMFEQLSEPYPGCLMASYVYESGLFNDRTMEVVDETMRTWRKRLGEHFAEVAERYPPRLDVDLEDLADAFTVVGEGAFIVSRILKEPEVTAAQYRHYRNYIELLFGAD